MSVSPERQQFIGVHTEEAAYAPGAYTLRVPGRIAADEQRQYRILAGADGWIRDLGNNAAGAFVKKNQVLAAYYTPNLISATQTYVFALQTNAQSRSGDATIGYQRGTTVLSLQVALDSLRSMGMSDLQIEEISQTRVAPDKIRIYSPADGFVIARNLSQEQRFDKGAELYRIANISRVWVQAEVFEKDNQFIKPGAAVTVRYAGRDFPARVSDTLQQFDPQSRTLKTRLEMDNPGFILRPDMFVEAEISVNLPPAITVSADSIVDSGLRQIVYVARDGGVYEPRVVKAGWRFGDRVQIAEGLKPGERVVSAGNFLIDSESRIRLADREDGMRGMK